LAVVHVQQIAICDLRLGSPPGTAPRQGETAHAPGPFTIPRPLARIGWQCGRCARNWFPHEPIKRHVMHVGTRQIDRASDAGAWGVRVPTADPQAGNSGTKRVVVLPRQPHLRQRVVSGCVVTCGGGMRGPCRSSGDTR
jgi:hypothetical protein